VDLSAAAPDPVQVLSDVAFSPWIPLAQRGPIYQHILDAKQKALAKAEGLEKEQAMNEVSQWQSHWVDYLVQTKQFAQAGDFISALPPETRRDNAASLIPLGMQIAAHLGTLDEKIAGYRADPPAAPDSEILRASARTLFHAGDKQSARKILEFVFALEIDEHRFVAANFLGLAEIRLASGDTTGALELLRRLLIVVENPYENLDSAAGLLEKTGHYKEAVEFLEPLSKSVPWEPSFQLRLAKAKIAATQDTSSGQERLVKIAAAPQVPYGLRVEAAVALAGAKDESDLGSGELNLLAGAPRGITVDAADQPFFYDARLRAAQTIADPRTKLQLLGNALAQNAARDDARVLLFHAAVAMNRNEYALAAIEQLLRQQQLLRAPVRVSNEQEEIGSADVTEPEADDTVEETSTPGSISAKLSLPQQAQVARSVGEVLAKLNRFDEALPYLQLAQKLEKAPGRQKEIRTEIANVRSRLRRDRQNAARQPIFHADLEQDRLVRPRLIAQSAPAAKTNLKAGQKP